MSAPHLAPPSQHQATAAARLSADQSPLPPNRDGNGRPQLDERLGATWRYDLPAGIVVFLVALPLCLGIALASGAPMLSGLITGIVGGLLVSRLSGSQLMVSGPAAGLTAIVIAALVELGSFERFLVAVVLAGALQVALGIARAGIIAYFFPSSVIRGMLAAIGLILILKQLPYALGAGILPMEMDNTDPASGGGGSLGTIVRAAESMRPLAVVLSLGALLVLAFWDRIAPERVRKVVPGALVAVLVGVVGAAVGAFAPGLALPLDTMVSLPTPESLRELASHVALPAWGSIADPVVWRVALTIGIVASLETLLSLEATDKLDPFKRNAPANRELFAQGVGNMVSGAIGGLPMTGVIVRSAANIGAGARTWRSSLLHGVLLLVAIVAIPGLLNRIPLAVLAAILLFTGYKLANPKLFRDAWRIGPKYFVPFVVTVGAILATDLLVGICIGLVVGTFFVLRDHYSHAYSYDVEESADHRRVTITLAEQVTFLNKARINEALHAVPAGSSVTVDALRSRHIDHDVIELLHEFGANARARGISLHLVGVPKPLAGAGGH
jgi:MFS superfamily sulfate permease-like transporter